MYIHYSTLYIDPQLSKLFAQNFTQSPEGVAPLDPELLTKEVIEKEAWPSHK